jgi:hypothetical protein
LLFCAATLTSGRSEEEIAEASGDGHRRYIVEVCLPDTTMWKPDDLDILAKFFSYVLEKALQFILPALERSDRDFDGNSSIGNASPMSCAAFPTPALLKPVVSSG